EDDPGVNYVHRTDHTRPFDSTPMTPTAADPRAWRADTLDDPAAWYCPLSEPALTALERTVRAAGQTPVLDQRATPELRPACARDLAPVRDAMETGRGFAVIPADRLRREDWPAAYWLLGQLLGEPFEQNVQGTLLYDVRDTGADVRYGVRFSVTNAESSFHTDNSFGDDVLDYVGLLCLCPAKSGGLS